MLLGAPGLTTRNKDATRNKGISKASVGPSRSRHLLVLAVDEMSIMSCPRIDQDYWMLYLFPLVYYYGDMKLGKDMSGIERVLCFFLTFTAPESNAGRQD